MGLQSHGITCVQVYVLRAATSYKKY